MWNMVFTLLIIGALSVLTNRLVDANIPNIHNAKCNRFFYKNIKSLLKNNPCAARDTYVDINTLAKYPGHLTPRLVMLKQCGGSACYHPFSCYPLATRPVNVSVMAHDPSVDQPVCLLVTVEEHLECGCGCNLRKHNCNHRQDYNPNLCSCTCNANNQPTSCTDVMEWDEEQCKCVCSREQLCSTGSHWVPDLCRCVAMSAQINYYDNEVLQ